MVDIIEIIEMVTISMGHDVRHCVLTLTFELETSSRSLHTPYSWTVFGCSNKATRLDKGERKNVHNMDFTWI